MTQAQKVFNECVAKVERSNPSLDYALCNSRAKILYPAEYAAAFPKPVEISLANSNELKGKVERAKEAATEFLKKVNERIDATHETFDVAWGKCKELHLALANEMTFQLPPNVKLMADGSAINTGAPSEEELAHLGLFSGVDPKILSLFRNFSQLKPSNELGWAIMAGLLRACQKESILSQTSWNESLALFTKCFPEIAKLTPLT